MKKLIDALNTCIEALRNVPEVGGVYDQQHSDTQLAAILVAQEAIADTNSLLVKLLEAAEVVVDDESVQIRNTLGVTLYLTIAEFHALEVVIEEARELCKSS